MFLKVLVGGWYGQEDAEETSQFRSNLLLMASVLMERGIKRWLRWWEWKQIPLVDRRIISQRKSTCPGGHFLYTRLDFLVPFHHVIVRLRRTVIGSYSESSLTQLPILFAGMDILLCRQWWLDGTRSHSRTCAYVLYLSLYQVKHLFAYLMPLSSDHLITVSTTHHDLL